MPHHHLAVMERLFAGLADRTRLRLLNLMAEQEVCVCYFVEILDAPQPTISRHLAYLRRSGLVEARREGKWMHYRIFPPANRFVRQVLIDTLLGRQRDAEGSRAPEPRLLFPQEVHSPAGSPGPYAGRRTCRREALK